MKGFYVVFILLASAVVVLGTDNLTTPSIEITTGSTPKYFNTTNLLSSITSNTSDLYLNTSFTDSMLFTSPAINITSTLFLPTTPSQDLSPTNLKCDFDTDMCSWTNGMFYENVDDFNWRRGTGRDAHRKKGGKQTGTKYDRNYNFRGGYVFIKATRKHRISRLFSPIFSSTKPLCFTFWFHMFGKDIGHLQVAVMTSRKGENERVVWKLNGNQGSFWRKGTVPLNPAGKKLIIAFEALDLETGRLGNIALDDVDMVVDTQCPLGPSNAVDNLPTPETTPTVTQATTSDFLEEIKTSFGTVRPTTELMGVKNSITTKVYKTQEINTQPEMNTIPLKEVKSTASLSTSVEITFGTSSTGVPKVAVVLSVLGVFLIIVIAGAAFLFHRRRQQQFEYYDNCTVAMTRMSPEVRNGTNSEYVKLHSPQ